MAVSASLFNGT